MGVASKNIKNARDFSYLILVYEFFNQEKPETFLSLVALLLREGG